jgi:hypothetical protein
MDSCLSDGNACNHLASRSICSSTMPPNSKPRAKGNRTGIIHAVTTPLAFYVLALLIIEATLALVLSSGKLSEERTWDRFHLMLATFVAVLAVVTALTVFWPKNLLYGKEEHANPLLAPSALRDQIEDLIAANVKAECLKS